MKIVTWNVRCQNETDDARGCGWKVRLPLVVETLRELAPDIFAVQEAHFEQINDLRAAFPTYQGAGAGREDGAKDGEQCGIFFDARRFKLREQRTRWLSESPDVPSRDWGAACTRIVTRVHLYDREAAHEMKVWNAHFDHRSALARLESARLLRRWMSEPTATPATAAATWPTILCGDFNCAPDAPPIAELTEIVRDSRAHATAVSGEVATFCGFDAPLHGENHRIDYVFADRFWNIESYSVPDDKERWPPASDHRPIIVQLTHK